MEVPFEMLSHVFPPNKPKKIETKVEEGSAPQEDANGNETENAETVNNTNADLNDNVEKQINTENSTEDAETPIELNVLPQRMLETNKKFISETNNMDLEIRQPMILNFPADKRYRCNKICIGNNIQVIFRNFHLCGLFEIDSSVVVFENCTFENDRANERIILASNKANITVTNSEFIAGKNAAILLFNESKIFFSATKFSNIDEYVIRIDNSNCRVDHCSFENCNSNFIYSDASKLRVFDSTFSNSGLASITCTNFSDVKIKRSTFSKLQKPAITISDSFSTLVRKCSITDCQDSSITIYHGNFVMEDSTISDTKGNCIFLSSGSHLEMKGGLLTNSDYPSIILINGSDGIIDGLKIDKANESGIVMRSDSSIRMENSIITNVGNVGIKISDGQNVKFKNVTVSNCQADCINVCDGSTVFFENCTVGKAKYNAFSIFTGSNVQINNSSIYGPYQSAIYLHRGGDAQISECRFAKRKSELTKASFVPTNFVTKSVSIFRIESKRPFFAQKCYIVGEKEGFNIVLNDDMLSAVYDDQLNQVHMANNDNDTKIEDISNDSNTVNNENLVKTSLNEMMGSGLGLYPPKCIECQKIIVDFRLSTCGHSVYCQDCWKAMENKPKDCPLCRTLINSAVKLFNESPDRSKTCAICYENLINCYLIPCGHTICKKCFLRNFQTSDNCPFCREQNVQVRRFVTYE